MGLRSISMKVRPARSSNGFAVITPMDDGSPLSRTRVPGRKVFPSIPSKKLFPKQALMPGILIAPLSRSHPIFQFSIPRFALDERPLSTLLRSPLNLGASGVSPKVKLAEAIHRNLEAALGASGVTDPLEGKTLNGQALSAARSRFESSKQRFFGQLLLSMKLPSLLPAIEEALDTDHSVVIQLVSTAEALLDRRLADLSAEDRAEIQLDLSPREIVADYLDNAFPTRAMESYWDEDGNERSRPMVDEAGNPIHSQEALRIKAETLELLGALPPIVPALDAIIARFGTDAVAEITGRTRRLVTLPDGVNRRPNGGLTQIPCNPGHAGAISL
eukprot:gene19041-19392_t